jgi:hypothetical protein
MKPKAKQDFDRNIQSVFNHLSVKGNYKVIGSNAVKGNFYGSDYDLMEFVREPNSVIVLNHIWDLFKNKFKEAERNSHIFITDFKCGEVDGEPIRWDKVSIQRGTEKGFTFQECLLQKSCIKLDMVVLVNGIFTAFSENYYLKIGNHYSYDPDTLKDENIISSLVKDVLEYRKENKLMKSLKRVASVLRLLKKHATLQQKLNSFFNSQTGYLYRCARDLGIILLVLDCSFRKPKSIDVNNNLQRIKQNISNIDEISLKRTTSGLIDDLCDIRDNSAKLIGIRNLKNYLDRKVNEMTERFIKENKIYEYLKL